MSDITDAADRLEVALDPAKRGGWTRLMDGEDGTSELDDLRTVLSAVRSHPTADDDFVAIWFDSGTTYALTGENAGHWVEGGPTHIPIEITNEQVVAAAETLIAQHWTAPGVELTGRMPARIVLGRPP